MCAAGAVLGLAEMMDVLAILRGDAAALEKIHAARACGRVIDGHAPAMCGRDLMAYIAAGRESAKTTANSPREIFTDSCKFPLLSLQWREMP
jgi:adenine deaminase